MDYNKDGSDLEFNRDAVARVIKMYRLKKDLSQEVLSGLAGIPRSHLTAIECGTKLPNFETIWRLCNALGLPPHEMVKSIEEDTAILYKGDK